MAQNHHNRDMDIDVPVEDDYEEAESESVISRIAPMILIAILIIAIIAVLGFGFVNLAKRAPRTNNYIQNEMQTTSETTAVSFEFVEVVTTAPHTSTAVTSTTTEFYDNFYESTRYSGKKSTTAATETSESGTMTTADTLESGTNTGSSDGSTTVRRYTDQNGTTRNITTETETVPVTAPPVVYTTQRPAETTAVRKTEPVQVITEKPETAPPMTSPQEPEPEAPETAPPITNPPETAPPMTSPQEPEPEAPETAPPMPSYDEE